MLTFRPLGWPTFLALSLLSQPAFGETALLDRNDAAEILEQRIDRERQATGIAVGLVDAGETRIVTHGTLGADHARLTDDDTMFEIGSLTKLFTGILLADAVQRGEVRLDQPVAELLSDGITIPEYGGRAITLLDLATHRSGLPRLPDNLVPANPAQPYAGYDPGDLHAFLAAYDLPRKPGQAFEYSNLGFGLLGHALSRNAGTTFEALFDERIFAPLGMEDTALMLNDDQQSRLAAGHDPSLRPVPAWEWDVLAGAGAIRSSVADMTVFLSAVAAAPEGALGKAIALSLRPQHPVGDGASEVGLGWMIGTLGEERLAWHDGATFGATAFLGVRPDRGDGVVVLANTFMPHGSSDLGLHLLDPATPLVAMPVEAEIDPAILERLIGDYRLTPEVTITVRAQDDRLFARLSGQEELELFPANATSYFYRAVDAQITFEMSEGHASALTLTQEGKDTHALRVDE